MGELKETKRVKKPAKTIKPEKTSKQTPKKSMKVKSSQSEKPISKKKNTTTSSDDDNNEEKKNRYYKIIGIGDDNTVYGRYVGGTPKQAARKAANKRFIKIRKEQGVEALKTIKLYLRESTNNSLKKAYGYKCTPRLLENPPKRVIIDADGNEKTIVYRFRNKIKKIPVPEMYGGKVSRRHKKMKGGEENHVRKEKKTKGAKSEGHSGESAKEKKTKEKKTKGVKSEESSEESIKEKKTQTETKAPKGKKTKTENLEGENEIKEKKTQKNKTKAENLEGDKKEKKTNSKKTNGNTEGETEIKKTKSKSLKVDA
jgi:hypothetical protein